MKSKNENIYLDIFKKALKLTWKNKNLWVFGFFILLGSGGLSFIKEIDNTDAFSISSLNLVILIIFAFFSLVLAIIGKASLIIFSGGKEQLKNKRLLSLFRKSRAFLRKLLMIEIIFILSLLLLLTTLLLPVLFLAMINLTPMALLIGLLALMIFVPVLTLFYFIKRLAYIYIALSNLNIFDSIEYAYTLFRKNIKYCLLFAIILMVLTISLLMIATFIFMLISQPLLTVLSKSVISLIFIFLLIIVQSFFETFRQIAWTLFFKHLADLKINREESLANEIGNWAAENV